MHANIAEVVHRRAGKGPVWGGAGRPTGPARSHEAIGIALLAVAVIWARVVYLGWWGTTVVTKGLASHSSDAKVYNEN